MPLYVRRSASGVPAGLPDAPAAPTITADLEELTATWSAPAGDGGSPVVSYDLRRSVQGAGAWTTYTGMTSPAVLTSLVDATTYEVQVRAVNGVGAGAWSASGVGTPGASLGWAAADTTHTSSASPPAVTTPGTPSTGDTLIFWSAIDADTAVTWTAPAGSTLVGTVDVATRPRMRVWWKAHDGTGSYTFGADLAGQTSGIVTLTDAASAVTLDGAANYGTSPDGPSTSVLAGDIVISVIATQGNPSITATPSGYTADTGNYTAPEYRGAGAAYKVVGSAGTEDPGAWAIGVATNWVASTIKAAQ